MRMPPDSAAASGRVAEAGALSDLLLCTVKYLSAGREPAQEGEPSALGSLLGLRELYPFAEPATATHPYARKRWPCFAIVSLSGA